MGKKSKKFPGQRRPIQATFTAPPPPTVNTGYKDAAIVVTREFKSLQIVLAGCGGNGAYTALHVGRLATVISQNEVDVQITLADPDIVKEENLGRQLFWQYDLGEAKAIACARRYGRDWGTRTMAFVGEYNESLLLGTDLTVLVGCVDGAPGRVALAETLKRHNEPGQLPKLIWLDLGNLRDTGRVLLGSAYHEEMMRGAFVDKNHCVTLPSPALQYPSLLIPQPEESQDADMSCAQMAAANLQSLNINAALAAQASDMLTRLLITKDLKRFACGVNVAAGSVKSSYVIPADVARAISRPASFVQAATEEGVTA